MQYLALRAGLSSEVFPRGEGSGVVPGDSPQRVLVIGEATAVGFGVLSHELGMAGHFSRQLARRTGRGVEWETRPFADLTIHTAAGTVHDRPLLDGVDVVPLMVGVGDSIRLTPQRTWRPVAARHTRLLNRVAAEIVASRYEALSVPFPPESVIDIGDPDAAQASRVDASWSRAFDQRLLGPAGAAEAWPPLGRSLCIPRVRDARCGPGVASRTCPRWCPHRRPGSRIAGGSGPHAPNPNEEKQCPE